MKSMNLFLAASVCLTCLLGVNLPVSANVINLNPAADTALFQGNPDNNLGGHTNFAAGTMANGSVSRALLSFAPGGAIPADAVINSVTLSLRITASGGQSAMFELHSALTGWGEGNKTGQNGAPATAGEATWKANFASTSLWGTPGGLAGTDFAPDSSASALAGASTLVFNSTPGMVADVRSWLNNPSGDFGWFLMCQSESTLNTARRFASDEDALGRGPVLTIDYTPVPEPSTLSIFGLAAVGAFWSQRRRRA
ncbi:MAG: hypothetical protein JWR69_2249 [Pedosphaera sp.]|nr:hypothetical protein [Pedosphaera sp.]